MWRIGGKKKLRKDKLWYTEQFCCEKRREEFGARRVLDHRKKLLRCKRAVISPRPAKLCVELLLFRDG